MNFKITYTAYYAKWVKKLKDPMTKARILARLNRVETGHFGDVKNIDGQISEMRFTFGAGVRIYYTVKKKKVVLLLVGGDKSSQQSDIKKARMILTELRN